MTKTQIRKEAKELNDHMYYNGHEGATKEYFEGRRFSQKTQCRIMAASIEMMTKAVK